MPKAVSQIQMLQANSALCCQTLPKAEASLYIVHGNATLRCQTDHRLTLYHSCT